MYRLVIAVLVALVTLGGAVTAGFFSSAGPDDDSELATYIRTNYTKFEYRVPMRDGVHLFTSVYTPSDRSKKWPILLHRTPYSVDPYGPDRYKELLGPTEDSAREGYIFVYQDVRGRLMSEGDFVNMRPHNPNKQGPGDVDESTDTYDTIEWLLAEVEGHNGRVGMWGNSYPGFYCSAGMIDSHPALAAVLPSAPIADWFWDDMHHHGAFVLSLSFNFFSRFGVARPEPTTEWPPRFDHGTPDGYRFFMDLGPLSNVNDEYFNGEIDFWNKIAAHPNYDEFWQARNILPHLKNIDCAVMTVGGLFDAEDLYGPFNTYRSIEENNPNAFNVLVMGPWSHGAWLRKDGRTLGSADFGFNTAEVFRREALHPFFRHFLKQEGGLDVPEAWIFETGANRWRRFDSWPPPELRRASLHLQAGSGLGFSPPLATEAFDEYVSDPAKPVPYTMEISTGWNSKYMVEDQRFAARRPDVLVYRTEPLEEDLTIAGPISAHLWVSTSAGDADWVVKLIDEYPGELPGFDSDSDEEDMGGTQRLIRSETLRGRFRTSYSEPEPFVPNEVTELRLTLQDVLHTFPKGHSIMVQIQSSLFPFIDRNPQTWVPNIFEATESDFVKATHRVYRSSHHPSALEVGILE